MKKFLFLLACAAVLFVGCKKENDTKEESGGNKNIDDDSLVTAVSEIKAPAEFSLIAGSAAQLIPISTKPSSTLPISELLEISDVDEAIVVCQLAENGMMATPVSAGKTTVKLDAKDGPAQTAEIEIEVFEEITGMKISFNAAGQPIYENSHYCITQGFTYLPEAIVMDKSGHTHNMAAAWETGAGAEVVQEEGITKLRVTLPGNKPSLKATVAVGGLTFTDSVNLDTYAAPTGIRISLTTSSAELKPNNDYGIMACVEPAYAMQKLYVSEVSGLTLSAEKIDKDEDGYTYKINIRGSETKYQPYSITLTSSLVPTVSKSFNVYMYEWLASDLKPGDYAYYNSKTNKYRTSDCGRRLHNYYYKDNLKQPAPTSDETYLGVVMEVFDSAPNNIPSDRLGTISNAYGKHVLVWSKKQINTAWDTSSNYETMNNSGVSSDSRDAYGYVLTQNLKQNHSSLTIVQQLNYFNEGNGGTSTGWFIYAPNDSHRLILESFENSYTTDPKPTENNYSYFWEAYEDSGGYAGVVEITKDGRVNASPYSYSDKRYSSRTYGKIYLRAGKIF